MKDSLRPLSGLLFLTLGAYATNPYFCAGNSDPLKQSGSIGVPRRNVCQLRFATILS
jgi:hypothetical protein